MSTTEKQQHWGGETDKAIANFPVSGEPIPAPVARWLGRIKGAAVGVGERDRSVVGPFPFVAPAHQGDNCGEEVATLLGEVVLGAAALPGVLVGAAFE